MWIIYQGGLFKHLLFQRRHTCVCLRENLAAPLKDMPGVFMVQWAERQIMQRHIFHPACWIEWQWARGCDLHTPLHSGWYFLMVLGRVNHLQQQQQQHRHPLTPSPAVRGRPRHVGLYLFQNSASSGELESNIPPAQTGSPLLGCAPRGRMEEISSGDGDWQTVLFFQGVLHLDGMSEALKHTHLYCIQGWRLCVGFDWDTSKSFKGYTVYTNCIVGYKIPKKKREKG